tara:strand:+ start:1453 stop:1611 length:159 start_codon:yes stop_codon:yes gene_type:complete
MSKFIKVLIIVLFAMFATACWLNLPIQLFAGLSVVLLVMSWASIIQSLTKRK